MATEDIGSNGSWLPLVSAGPQGDRELTRDDLDSMVDNFNLGAAKRIPVVFGRPTKNGPALAQMDALQRKGDALAGRLSGVDPRAARLMQAGMLKKRVVQIKGHGMPEGPSITGVGLIHRQRGANGVWEECPADDASLNAICENSGKVEADSQFADRSTGGTHVSFEEEDSTRRKLPVDTNGERLTALAWERAEKKSIGFGEALLQVAGEQPQLTVPHMEFREQRRQLRAFDRNGERLTALAKQRAGEKTISFGEALTQVAAEHPELTTPTIEFRER
jgi:hypothetical protein